jgi:hypothetical protein
VIEPKHLRKTMQERAKSLLARYKKTHEWNSF